MWVHCGVMTGLLSLLYWRAAGLITEIINGWIQKINDLRIRKLCLSRFQVESYPHFVLVQNGIENKMNYPSSDPVRLEVRANTEPFRLLMNQKEDVSIRYYLTDKVHAPVSENTRLGIMKCYLGDQVIREFPLVATKTIAKRTLKTCFDYVILKYINITD